MMQRVRVYIDHKASVNDHLRGEPKAAMFHAEIERLSDTLFITQ
jgi:hypothetical protein